MGEPYCRRALFIDGVEYRVDANQPPNLLHGGFTGFGHKLWRARHEGDALVLTLESPAGDAGFPGALTVQVTYTFSAAGELTIEYEAAHRRPHPLNLTNHAYFNLSGVASNVGDHEIQLSADQFFAVDETDPDRAGRRCRHALRLSHGPAVLGPRLLSDDEQVRGGLGVWTSYVLSIRLRR